MFKAFISGKMSYLADSRARRCNSPLTFWEFHATTAYPSSATLGTLKCGVKLSMPNSLGMESVSSAQMGDQLLGNYRVVADVPAAAFAEDLCGAYPEAKVVVVESGIDMFQELW